MYKSTSSTLISISEKDFAQKLLDGAEMLYGFAKSNRGLFSDCVTNGYT